MAKQAVSAVAVAEAQNFQTKKQLIFAMDRDNAIALRKLAPAGATDKNRLLRGSDDIPDPYYSGDAAFRSTFQIIETSLNAIVHDF